jgi:hypothetical protein
LNFNPMPRKDVSKTGKGTVAWVFLKLVSPLELEPEAGSL